MMMMMSKLVRPPTLFFCLFFTSVWARLPNGRTSLWRLRRRFASFDVSTLDRFHNHTTSVTNQLLGLTPFTIIRFIHSWFNTACWSSRQTLVPMFFSIKMLKLPLSKCQDFLLQQISMVGHFSGGGFHEGGRRRPLLWSLGSHTLSIFSFMQKNLFSLFQEPQALKIELTCSHLVKLFIHAKQNNFHFFRICGSPGKKI